MDISTLIGKSFTLKKGNTHAEFIYDPEFNWYDVTKNKKYMGVAVVNDLHLFVNAYSKDSKKTIITVLN